MDNQQNHSLVINAFDRYYANKKQPTLADLMRETGLSSESIFEEIFREFRDAVNSAKEAGDAADAVEDCAKAVEPILYEIASDLMATGYLQKRYTLPIGTRRWILLEGTRQESLNFVFDQFEAELRRKRKEQKKYGAQRDTFVRRFSALDDFIRSSWRV